MLKWTLLTFSSPRCPFFSTGVVLQCSTIDCISDTSEVRRSICYRYCSCNELHWLYTEMTWVKNVHTSSQTNSSVVMETSKTNQTSHQESSMNQVQWRNSQRLFFQAADTGEGGEETGEREKWREGRVWETKWIKSPCWFFGSFNVWCSRVIKSGQVTRDPCGSPLQPDGLVLCSLSLYFSLFSFFPSLALRFLHVEPRQHEMEIDVISEVIVMQRGHMANVKFKA